MTIPPYPMSNDPSQSAPQPGMYPLRPLAIGEIFGAAARVAVRHLLVLAPLAFVISAVGLGVQFSILASNGALGDYASGQLTAVPAGATPAELNDILRRLYTDFLPAVGLSTLVSLIGAPILAAVATPFAALGATSRVSHNNAGLARLRGRWPVLLGTGVVVGLAVGIGSLLLVVPGVMAYLILMPAGPVAAMEGSSLRDTLRRAAVVSKGFRGRLFGVGILTGLIAGGISLVVSSVVGSLVGTSNGTTHLLATSVVSLLVGAFTTAWSASVVAMLYIDIRIRREGLAGALLAAASPSPFS
ncbi:hypothetical protein [Nakamurella sp. PAMC28650]|uniref:hypothetical protein n=1 Tax=Nakamurella sp. PAMC28650 TaxID=2762325 RepID=UPI00164D7830|nr:hypothetical protein [Nakamurella sp. PAMC28650]QNK80839.1 hypothetical protein H7F38_22500 [Nakamurella sp. PAMC28650]